MKTSGTAAPLPNRGMWIAFLGPDGVGKSAVINRLRPVGELQLTVLISSLLAASVVASRPAHCTTYAAS